MPIATRLTNAGTLLVNGSFDENTSISPAKFRTTSTAVYAAELDEVSFVPGSWTLAGSQGVTVGNSSAFALPGDFTVEFFFYLASVPAGEIDFWESQTTSSFRILKRGSSSGLSYDAYGGTSYLIVADASIPVNAWNHVAVSRTGTTVQAYFNGTRTINQTDATSFAAPTANYGVGCRATGANSLTGSISNFRLITGAGMYTGATIPVPTAPLGAVSGTQLLLTTPNTGGAFFDYSTNNFTVTKVSTPTSASSSPFTVNTPQRSTSAGVLQVKNIFDEFTGAPVVNTNLSLWLDAAQTTSYPGTGATWTDLSGNGNNGTLVNSPTYSTSNGGYFSFGSGGTQRTSFTYQTPVQSAATAFTWNIWAYPVANSDSYVLMGYRGTTPLQFYKLTTQKFEMYPAEIFYLFTLNVWQNICVIYDGTQSGTNNMKMYLNGTQVGLRDADQPDLSPSAMPFYVGGDPIAGEYATARISQVMVYNRALTADEITTNFNALRNRYGI